MAKNSREMQQMLLMESTRIEYEDKREIEKERESKGDRMTKLAGCKIENQFHRRPEISLCPNKLKHQKLCQLKSKSYYDPRTEICDAKAEIANNAS